MNWSAWSAAENIAKDVREDLWNERAYYQQGVNKQASEEEAKRNRQFQMDMYSHRYSLTMEDLRRSGLNPLLAVTNGPGGTPGGGQAQIPGVSGPAPRGAGAATGVVIAQTAQIQAQNEMLKASADKARAEAEATRATYPVNIETMRQKIAESIQNVKTLMATETHQYGSAGQAFQQTANLKAQIPQIEATIKLLGAQTVESLARAGLAQAEASRVLRELAAKMPEINAALADLKQQALQLEQPRLHQEATLHKSWMGALSALFRNLNPLQGLFMAVTK